MEENYLLRAMASAFWIFMAGVTSATAIWLVRRFMSRKAAYWLTTPMGTLIRRLRGREQFGRQEVLPSDREALGRSAPHQAGRD